MGFMALGFFVAAVVAATFVFQFAKSVWRIPAILNLPGAFLVFNAIVSFSGWLTHDLFERHTYMPAPDIPWHYWLVYLGLAIGWYMVMVYALLKWRATTNTSIKTE